VRAVWCSAFGPPEQLRVEERPSPALGDHDVRVAVAAAGVNFVDGLLVQGLYQIKPPLPFVPGNEVAGRIVEVGPAVEDRRVGQRVAASVGLGGFASDVVIRAHRALPVPDGMTDGQAATFSQSYLTARFALQHRARATAGQWLLVLGAGGGVGLAAVDVGRSMGLHVIAAASSEAKREIARGRGAEAVIDSSGEDVTARARELAGGDGVDLVYDPVGGAQGERALRALREDGQYLVVGFASGEIPKLPANQVLLRNRRVTGVDWGAWAGRDRQANHEMLADVLACVERGELRPVEPMAYPLAEAHRALRDQLERRVTGKSVLVP